MKAKNLITNNDFIVNPTKPVFGEKIPIFTPPGTEERGNMNYGAFLVEKLANNRSKPILNALVNYFFNEDAKEREAAECELRKFAEEYKIKEDLPSV